MNAINPDTILECVRQYRSRDKRVTKSGIAAYLKLPYSNSHNNQTDRAIRDAITELRNKGEPIATVSGKAGYCYGWENIDYTIADYKSRGAKEFETAGILERGLREYQDQKARDMVKHNQPVVEAVQLRMIWPRKRTAN